MSVWQQTGFKPRSVSSQSPWSYMLPTASLGGGSGPWRSHISAPSVVLRAPAST